MRLGRKLSNLPAVGAWAAAVVGAVGAVLVAALLAELRTRQPASTPKPVMRPGQQQKKKRGS